MSRTTSTDGVATPPDRTARPLLKTKRRRAACVELCGGFCNACYKSSITTVTKARIVDVASCSRVLVRRNAVGDRRPERVRSRLAYVSLGAIVQVT